MITDIPTADDFKRASLGLLDMAWDAIMMMHFDIQSRKNVLDTANNDETYGISDEPLFDVASYVGDYWARNSLQINSAYAIVQQSVELALKGYIAEVSPFLLINVARQDGSQGGTGGKSTSRSVRSFSEFATIDAVNLISVVRQVSNKQLSSEAVTFWDGLRRKRNTVMHSVQPSSSVKPAELILTILNAHQYFHPDARWANRRVYRFNDVEILSGFDGKVSRTSRDTALEILSLKQYLTPSEIARFFSFRVKDYRFFCPICCSSTSHNFQKEFPKIAQLTDKRADCTTVFCCVCEQTQEVTRGECIHCKNSVLDESGIVCLSCLGGQEDPELPPSDPG